jgi:hypothetical protein
MSDSDDSDDAETVERDFTIQFKSNFHLNQVVLTSFLNSEMDQVEFTPEFLSELKKSMGKAIIKVSFELFVHHGLTEHFELISCFRCTSFQT